MLDNSPPRDILGLGGRTMEENKNSQPNIQGESKTAIGFVCAFFLGLIGLIIGFCCFKPNTYERKTFMKGFWWTFGICAGVTVLFIIIYFIAFGSLVAGVVGSI